MSWSKLLVVENGEVNASEPNLSSGEQKEQYVNACESAKNLIALGVVGDPNGKYNVTLSGHVNPGHKPQAGWSNDCLTISIYQDN